VTPLQAPSQAAPSGVAVTASSVSSPNSAPNVPTTTASSVTSPNASVSSPSVVSSVSSPSSSSAVSSVSSVTLPVSSVKPVGVTVKPLDYVRWDGSCVNSDIGTDKGSGCDPKNLQEKADALDEKIKRETDERRRIELMEQYTLTQARLVDLRDYGKTNISAYKALERIYKSPMYNSAAPKFQLTVLRETRDKLGTGEWDGKDLKLLANTFESFKFDSNGVLKCILKPVDCQNGMSPTKGNSAKQNGQNTSNTSANTGYTDLSFGLSLVLGVSGGFLINHHDGAVYFYAGPTLGTPGLSDGVTVSGNAASAGCLWQFSASGVLTLTMGASGSKNSDNFAEVGATIPGASVQIACAVQIRPPNPPTK
jgi:hypothetical protein